MPSTAYVTLTIMPDAHTKSTSCALALAPPPRNPNERRELLPRRHREVDSVLLLFAVWRGFVDAVNRAAALGGRQSRGYHVRARKMDAVREELCDSATDAAIALEPLELCRGRRRGPRVLQQVEKICGGLVAEPPLDLGLEATASARNGEKRAAGRLW